MKGVFSKIHEQWSVCFKAVFFSNSCFRRFIWNFFRLENEHLNNCGQFRAVRDISVVPMETDDQAFLEQMMDDMDGLVPTKRTGQRRRKSSVMTKSIKKISSKTDGVVIKRDTEVIIENETVTSLWSLLRVEKGHFMLSQRRGYLKIESYWNYFLSDIFFVAWRQG